VDGAKQWMYAGIELRNETSNHSTLGTIVT
jgi:hypothetical protein